ncbi:13929_t:CDS:2, partial [Gigaspora margarita]
MSKSIGLQTWLEKTLKEEGILKYDYSVYENVEVIGIGGFGIVYSANYYGKKFALKSLKHDEVKEASKEFIKEVKQLRTVTSHPNINQFYGITCAYLDPHCYGQPGKKPDEKSDIYSLG